MGSGRRARQLAVGTVVAAVVMCAAGVGVVITGSAGGYPSPTKTRLDLSAVAPSPSTTPTATSTSASAVTVVAIGDSIMDGHGVSTNRAWPELVGQATDWQLTDLARDGPGFAAVGNDGTTFQAQATEAVSLKPSIVIVAASSNDLGEDPVAVADATMATMTYLRAGLPGARIIALNAFWGNGTPPAGLSALDDDLQVAAGATGAHYLDIGQPLAGKSNLIQADGVHPTARGLTVLAAAIAAAIRGGALLH